MVKSQTIPCKCLSLVGMTRTMRDASLNLFCEPVSCSKPCSAYPALGQSEAGHLPAIPSSQEMRAEPSTHSIDPGKSLSIQAHL